MRRAQAARRYPKTKFEIGNAVLKNAAQKETRRLSVLASEEEAK